MRLLNVSLDVHSIHYTEVSSQLIDTIQCLVQEKTTCVFHSTATSDLCAVTFFFKVSSTAYWVLVVRSVAVAFYFKSTTGSSRYGIFLFLLLQLWQVEWENLTLMNRHRWSACRYVLVLHSLLALKLFLLKLPESLSFWRGCTSQLLWLLRSTDVHLPLFSSMSMASFSPYCTQSGQLADNREQRETWKINITSLLFLHRRCHKRFQFPAFSLQEFVLQCNESVVRWRRVTLCFCGEWLGNRRSPFQLSHHIHGLNSHDILSR